MAEAATMEKLTILFLSLPDEIKLRVFEILVQSEPRKCDNIHRPETIPSLAKEILQPFPNVKFGGKTIYSQIYLAKLAEEAITKHAWIHIVGNFSTQRYPHRGPHPASLIPHTQHVRKPSITVFSAETFLYHFTPGLFVAQKDVMRFKVWFPGLDSLRIIISVPKVGYLVKGVFEPTHPSFTEGGTPQGDLIVQTEIMEQTMAAVLGVKNKELLLYDRNTVRIYPVIFRSIEVGSMNWEVVDDGRPKSYGERQLEKQMKIVTTGKLKHIVYQQELKWDMMYFMSIM